MTGDNYQTVTIKESVLDEIIQVLYPDNPELSPEANARAYRHLKFALMYNESALTEDIQRLLEMVKNEKV